MEEIIFLVGEADEDGFIAKGLGVAIFAQNDTYEKLKTCYY